MGESSANAKEVIHIDSIPDFVEQLLAYSCLQDVSDVHIDPQDKQTVVRIRTLGTIRQLYLVHKRHHEELIGRLKILSRLRTDIHERGQDGRFTFLHEKEKVDIRVSILPTFYGENAVLRLLRPERGRMQKLTELGMFEDQAKAVIEELARHQGMVIIAGPTGSGKTTTLYTMVTSLLQSERNVVTIEDPIEYLIPGVRQIQVSENADFSFSKALRSILRQDPDVIVVGEMRDAETASLAFQASLTGHLVITSLHAEDCAGVCARLRDLGISKELLHSLTLVMSQRLITLQNERTAVFEVLQVSGKLKLALFQNSFPEYIRLSLHKHGATLLQDSARKRYELLGLKVDVITGLGLPTYDDI